ncbi:MAG TPA: hypothetical protein VE684_07260 [Crenalkalicoccus sp.]|nr:hypothetical protein [Crenalkalicoccus sp.]
MAISTAAILAALAAGAVLAPAALRAVLARAQSCRANQTSFPSPARTPCAALAGHAGGTERGAILAAIPHAIFALAKAFAATVRSVPLATA